MNTHARLQARLRARRPALVARALLLRRTEPDPVAALVALFASLPGDAALWRAVLSDGTTSGGGR